jgi:hypothetical protein
MTTRRRPRVAIAVEPTILGDALTAVLREVGVDDVVNLRDPHEMPTTADFDAAVVTIVLPDSVDAEVVIELPDTATGEGLTNVRHEDHCDTVDIRGLDDILRLLDDFFPCSGQPRLPRGTTPEAGPNA